MAAFIAEPVQGAGGVIVPPSSYWPEIQRICDRHGILLVSDEVVCGFGRGPVVGLRTFGTTPDLMTFAKGVTSGYVPLGGVMVGERIARVLIEQGGEFEHGYTYSGPPWPARWSLANLDLIERQELVKRVRDDTALPGRAARGAGRASDGGRGAELRTDGRHPALPQRAAARSLRPRNRHRHGVPQALFDHGLVMRAVGDRMIIAPPLIITRAQVDEMMVLMRKALDRTYAEVRAAGWLHGPAHIST